MKEKPKPTKKTQITFQGVRASTSQWAEMCGVNFNQFIAHFSKHGCTVCDLDYWRGQRHG